MKSDIIDENIYPRIDNHLVYGLIKTNTLKNLVKSAYNMDLDVSILDLIQGLVLTLDTDNLIQLVK